MRKLKMVIVTALSGLLAGCVATAQRVRSVKAVPTADVRAVVVVPDSAPAVVAVVCNALTKAGKRCSRKAKQGQTMCSQHRKMVEAGKEVKLAR